MATELRCPRGHLWRPEEFDEEAGQLDPSTPVACPYCGALCTVVAEPPTRVAPATKHDPPVTAEPSPQPIVPGYEILDILGRGGMGVVYKARQIRTDRIVALKVPGHLDLETRVRFTTEAQAAARISHPHIVQLYEVGEHQGRPFLALEFVDGGTLAAMLTGAPIPPREAAILAATLAAAVGAAHAQGVIHRDLKPANILLQKDEGGRMKDEGRTPPLSSFNLHPSSLRPKVADFGLARRIDTDTGQTRSGMVLGTPDYMAPEQAEGRNKDVGPPADVFALGVILYELLTGRVPFKGTGMLETLEQVRTLEPVAPRRLQPGVPRDLETICLKCLQKDPARRYSEAGEMADDLRRFLDGLPVRARAISRVARWIKRGRRNPLATGLAAGLWLVLIAAAVYGVVYHLRLQRERDRVQEERDRAQAQRDRARYHLDMSMRSIEGLLTEVAEEDLAAEPRAELKRRALLKKALALYEELLQVEPDDPGLAWLAARAARRVGDIQRLLGRYPEALIAYQQALDRLGPLEENPPPGTDPGREIADVHNFIGEVYRLRGEPAKARAPYTHALALQQELLKARPDDQGYRQDLARTRYNLGIVARRQGRPADAVTELAEAARLLSRLPVEDMAARHHRARIYVNLGAARLDNRELPEADRACREAIALFDALIADSNGRPDFRYERAVAIINLGLVRLKSRDPAGARAELERAREVLERLSDRFPSTRPYKVELAQTYNDLAAVAFDDYRRAERAPFDHLVLVACQVGSAREAAAMSGKAADVWTDLIQDGGTPEIHGDLGVALGNQGLALEKLHPDEARTALTRGLKELVVGLRASPGDSGFRDSLRKQSRAVAGLLVRAGDHDSARALARHIAAELPDPVQGAHRAAALLAGCVAATDGDRPPTDEAKAYEALAIELVERAGRADWSDLRSDPDCAPLLARSRFATAVGK